MAKTKFYTVWRGKTPGVYLTWKECEAQVKGQPGAKFKGFDTRQAAEKALNDGFERYFQSSGKPGKPRKKKGEPVDFSRFPEINPLSISVDAACAGNPGVMEYQGVDTATEQRLFHKKFAEGTNNIGEFLAIVHALAMMQKKGDQRPIYSDSRIAMNWVLRDKRCKTKLTPSAKNAELFDFVKRAEDWLRNNTWPNKLIKWETKEWGEIPADFGRK